MSLKAAKKAMEKAKKKPHDIDAVITACSNLERAYPAISIEVQELIGIKGFAFDMNVACSSATFAIQAAADMIKSGSAKTILIVDPEICSGHLDFKDRDCHFIFGDVCTAMILEKRETVQSNNSFEILSTTNLSEKGISTRVIQELARHSSMVTTQRYIDVSNDKLKNAVDLI